MVLMGLKDDWIESDLPLTTLEPKNPNGFKATDRRQDGGLRSISSLLSLSSYVSGLLSFFFEIVF